MFINFWYPAEESINLKDEPMQVRMLGQDFVLFRDSSGAAHCLSNVCVHRGGSLANGKLKDDCVECPYHGWQFDGEGACTRIPSMGPDAKIPNRAKVDSYPTVEKYGLIFAFLGDLPEAERPPIMEIEEWGGEGWRATHQRFDWDFDYKRSVENGLDMAHNEFVHTTHIFTVGDENYQVPELELVENEWMSGFYNKVPGQPLADEKMRKISGREGAGTAEVGTGHHGCASLWTFIHPNTEMKIHQYAFEAPVDESHTRIFLVNLRNFMPEAENDQRMMERNTFVALQDHDVLLELRPVLTPHTNTKEVFVPADKPVSRYRDFIKEWETRGWRIDIDEVTRNQDQVAYAIPGPARRQSKGWALDPIPLISPAQAQQAAAE